METLIIIISVILFVLSIIGCFNPIFPGPPAAYLSILILHFFTSYSFGINILIFLTFFLIFITVLDYWMQIKGVKYFGGGKYAERGVLIGIIFGLFFSPIGIIIGPLLGSFLGAKLEKNDFVSSLKISVGALIGFFGGVIAKLAYVFFAMYHSILII